MHLKQLDSCAGLNVALEDRSRSAKLETAHIGQLLEENAYIGFVGFQHGHLGKPADAVPDGDNLDGGVNSIEDGHR